jgi:DNA polymerase
MEAIGSIYKRYSSCTKCDLHIKRNKLVFGTGPEDAKIVIVGEAPGEEEDRKGEPFVGRAGQLLKNMLRGSSIRKKDVFLTNTVCCRPTTDDGKNRQPSTVEMEACSKRLLETIYSIDPLLIIGTGKVPVQLLTKNTAAITKMRGNVYKALIPGKTMQLYYPVLAVLHPAFLLRNPDISKKGWLPLTAEDFRKAKRIVKELRR